MRMPCSRQRSKVFPRRRNFRRLLKRKLLATLADTDEVKRAAAFRKRQVDLQLSYGNALIAARGHGASETTAAFARARELAAGIANPEPSNCGLLWPLGRKFYPLQIPLAREVSAAALQLAERYPGTAEAAVAYRLHGLIYWYEGDFTTARQFLERSLSMFESGAGRTRPRLPFRSSSRLPWKNNGPL